MNKLRGLTVNKTLCKLVNTMIVHQSNKQLNLMKQLILPIVLLFLSLSIMAQELVSTAGGSAKTSDIQMDWSIGEIATETLESNEVTVTQGFHQPLTVISTSIEEWENTNFNFVLKPNPTKDFVQITFQHESLETVDIYIFSISGKLIQHRKNMMSGSELDLTGFGSGEYVIHLSDKKDIVKTYKVIKN